MLQSASHSKNDENQEIVMTTEEITEEVTNEEIDTSLLEIERPTTCEMASQTEWRETTSVQIGDDIEKDSIVVEDGYDTQVEVFPDLDDDAPPVRCERSECVKVNSEVELEVKEPMDIVVSQETATSGSQYTPSLKNEDQWLWYMQLSGLTRI